MSIKNRFYISVASFMVLGTGCWIVLLPHLVFQYIIIAVTSAAFGGSIFAITDTEEEDNISNIKKEISDIEEEISKKEKKKKEEVKYTKPTNVLLYEINKIINPIISKKFKEIYSLSTKINAYGIQHNCMDKLNVWNIVYVNEITKLLNEYNNIVRLPDQNNVVIAKIDEFTKLTDTILEKFTKQYDNLISGHIESFDIDMSLVKKLSE